MLVVGEKINSTRKRVAEAVEAFDAGAILDLARCQADAGADFIDVNAGTFGDREAERLVWLVETVQSGIDKPLCLDSPSPAALEAAVKVHRGEPMINSISLEADRFEPLLSLVGNHPARVVALCMGKTGIPATAAERVRIAGELVEALTGKGVALEKIYVDPLVQPVSVDTHNGSIALDAIAGIRQAFPGVNTICGLSNISFGLPERRLINRTFLSQAMARGLSAAILDPLDRGLMSVLCSARMLLGEDVYCEGFLTAYEGGRLDS